MSEYFLGVDWQLAFIFVSLSFLVILIDVFFVPTAILSILSVLGFLIYIIYVGQSSLVSAAVILFGYSVFVLTFLYVAKRFKLWRTFQLFTAAVNDDPAGRKISRVVEKELFGYAHTDLRPSGTVRLGEKRYDALSADGMYIKKGEKVFIQGRSVGQLIVQKRPLPKNSEKGAS